MVFDPEYIVTGVDLPDTIQGAWGKVNLNLIGIQSDIETLESGIPEIVTVDGGDL